MVFTDSDAAQLSAGLGLYQTRTRLPTPNDCADTVGWRSSAATPPPLTQQVEQLGHFVGRVMKSYVSQNLAWSARPRSVRESERISILTTTTDGS